MKPKLILTFDAGLGEKYSICMDIEKDIAEDIKEVVPLAERPTIISFTEAVHILRTRKFRKDVFVRLCTNLGARLAERMEDAEGWHDESRIEPAKKELRGG